MTLTVLTAADQLAEDLPPDLRLRVVSAMEALVEQLAARELSLVAREQALIQAELLADRRELQLARHTEAMLAQPALKALEEHAMEQERKRALSLIDEQLLWLLPTGHCVAILKTLRRKIEFHESPTVRSPDRLR
jgi:hypothetical protein